MDKLHSVERILRELREEISLLRKELQRIEASLIAERLQSVERAMAQNYIELYLDQAEEGMDETVEHILREECRKRELCKQNFKNSLIESFNAYRKEGLKEALIKLDEELIHVEAALKKSINTSCETCYRKLQKSLQKQRKNLQKIAGLRSTAEELETRKQVDLSNLVKDVLEPIANPARLKILIAVHQGRKGFSELSEVTGMKGGHIIFHLKRLLHSGLITQNGRKGDYIITSKGEKVIKKILSI